MILWVLLNYYMNADQLGFTLTLGVNFLRRISQLGYQPIFMKFYTLFSIHVVTTLKISQSFDKLVF